MPINKRPRDSLGRPARILRYPIKKYVQISPDAADKLTELAQKRGIKEGKLIRRALMKELYIYEAKKTKEEKHEDTDEA